MPCVRVRCHCGDNGLLSKQPGGHFINSNTQVLDLMLAPLIVVVILTVRQRSSTTSGHEPPTMMSTCRIYQRQMQNRGWIIQRKFVWNRGGR